MKKIFMLTLLSIFSLTVYAQESCEAGDEGGDESYKLLQCNMIDLESLDEVDALPYITYQVAIHFVANSNGENFTCDLNDPILNINELLYGPLFAEKFISNANNRMAEAVILDGQVTDAKIRFELVNGGGCNSVFFYTSANQVQYLDNAINVRFLPSSGNSGYTNYGSNRITQRGALVEFLSGSNNFWKFGDTFVHEFGHTRNLRHTFNCNNPCNGDGFIVEEEVLWSLLQQRYPN